MSKSNTEVPAIQQSEEDKSWLSELDQVDKLIEEEDLKNRKYRKRLLFLLPFNAFSLWATIRYFKNIHKIGKMFWPTYQKATLKNLFVVGTAQALFFTTFYIGGSLAILGINPIAVYQRRVTLVGGPTMEELIADEENLDKAVQGMSTSDAVVLRVFKSMGLSDKTMVSIERDLREQQKQAQIEMNAQKETKKDDSATK